MSVYSLYIPGGRLWSLLNKKDQWCYDLSKKLKENFDHSNNETRNRVFSWSALTHKWIHFQRFTVEQNIKKYLFSVPNSDLLKPGSCYLESSLRADLWCNSWAMYFHLLMYFIIFCLIFRHREWPYSQVLFQIIYVGFYDSAFCFRRFQKHLFSLTSFKEWFLEFSLMHAIRKLSAHLTFIYLTYS